ncbi:hypothetical protein [Moraxella phage Mcat6]|nr:hypothetical protein [Moraxella phage Mcat6]
MNNPSNTPKEIILTAPCGGFLLPKEILYLTKIYKFLIG